MNEIENKDDEQLIFDNNFSLDDDITIKDL